MEQINTGMRYYELFEELTPAERMQRDADKRRSANAKRDAARRRKVNAAQRYQDMLRSSNDAIQSANNALARIKSS